MNASRCNVKRLDVSGCVSPVDHLYLTHHLNTMCLAQSLACQHKLRNTYPPTAGSLQPFLLQTRLLVVKQGVDGKVFGEPSTRIGVGDSDKTIHSSPLMGVGLPRHSPLPATVTRSLSNMSSGQGGRTFNWSTCLTLDAVGGLWPL